jgi:2-isopropylmalate synthase
MRSHTLGFIATKIEHLHCDRDPQGPGRRPLRHGPFHALHVCLRKCLSKLYPQITDVRLTDYKVRVLDSNKGTAANVRVLIEWSDHKRSWSTVGVSDNVIEASWKALVDAIRLELMRLTEKDDSIEKAVEDYCWGV